MLDVERHAAPAAVDALAAELLKEVFLEFVARQIALLILNAGNVRILHQLRVELHKFHSNAAHRRKPAKTAYPGHRSINTVLQRGRETPFGPSAVQKARRTVAQIAASSAAPELTARRERVAYRSAAVPKVDEEERMVLLLIILANYGYAGFL